MIASSVLALVFALQISAGLLAARLFWRKGRSRAWMLVVFICVGIGLRRSILLLAAMQENIYTSEQLTAELGSLLTLSLLLLASVFVLNYFIESLERTNQALRESEFTFRTMVENLPGAVYRSKADTDYAMLYVSDGIEALTGYPAEDFINNQTRSYASIIHDNDVSIWYGRQKKVSHNEPYDVRYRLRRADGSVVYVQDKGRGVCDAQGETLWLTGFLWDVTTSVEAEETRLSLEHQVQHAQKLKSIGVLSGGIAHDFNNLLMAIYGHSELAMLELERSAPARDNVLKIQHASQRAADLCRQLLAYSGRGAFEIKKIRLQELIVEMLDLLKTSISKKVMLNIELPEGLPPVLGDASQINQVMMNLITNASDAIDSRKGVITVTGSIIETSDDVPSDGYLAEDMPRGQYICIKVADTGCGMDKETKERIFDPFYTTKATGRGLGMSAVLGIVRGHKGALVVRSRKGVGTTFEVYLPAARRESHSTTFMAPEALDTWKGSGLILLVDDEDELRLVAGKMLERLGFDVITAANGMAAIDIFKKRSAEIEAVVLDLTMPDMDGEETFHELKRHDKNVRVIIASGFSMQEIEERFENKGLLGALHKPYSMQTLRKTLRAHLDDSPPDATKI